MTLVEERFEQFQETGSMSCLAFARTFSLATALAMAYPQAAVASQLIGLGFDLTATNESSSLQASQFGGISDDGDAQLFSMLTRVYGDLLSSQEELDEVAKSALYSNLWDLYE